MVTMLSTDDLARLREGAMGDSFTAVLRDLTTREVRCVRVGHFAIHRSLDGSGFAVSHVGTGQLLEDGFMQAVNAARLAKALEGKADWSFTTKQAIYDMAPALRDMLRGECRWFRRDDRMRANAARVTARGGEGAGDGN